MCLSLAQKKTRAMRPSSKRLRISHRPFCPLIFRQSGIPIGQPNSAVNSTLCIFYLELRSFLPHHTYGTGDVTERYPLSTSPLDIVQALVNFTSKRFMSKITAYKYRLIARPSSTNARYVGCKTSVRENLLYLKLSIFESFKYA